MSNIPYRYRISDWHQLPKCKSNNSRELSLYVSDIVQNDNLHGTKIELRHKEFGTLFAYVVDAYGDMISEQSEGVVFEISKDEILEELKKYGFLISYIQSSNLPKKTLDFLETVQGLGYDKIRLLVVQDVKAGETIVTWYIVAFNIVNNQQWLNNAYSPNRQEFNEAIQNGSAFNLSNLSEAQKINWSWLKGWVANISDILHSNNR